MILSELKKRRDCLARHLREISGISFNVPDSTFYLFPDMTDIYDEMGCKSYEDFRSRILRETGVSFCTREHFGTPLENEDRKYIRFAYSGISTEKIDEGMQKIKQYILMGSFFCLLETNHCHDKLYVCKV